jgi:hypothetical protein
VHRALTVLNELVSEGVIPSYAIGGAIGASFYIEAQATEDVDVFVVLPQSAGGLSVLTPVYDACKAKGGIIEGAHVRFGPWPVQILDPYKPLVEEALAQAVEVDFDGIPTRVMTAEHLCAICLDTGRPKDILRVALFIEQDAVDRAALEAILARYNLLHRTASVPNWTAGGHRGDGSGPA